MALSSLDTHSNPTTAELTSETQIQNLRIGDSGERYYAAWWLGRMRIQDGVTALIEALDYDQDRTIQGGYPVRRNAAQALGKLHNPDATQPLIHLFKDCEDHHLLGIIAQSLGEISTHHPAHIPQVSRILLDRLQSQDTAQIPAVALEGILETLGSLQITAAQPLIQTYLTHGSIRVQCSAARALYLITRDPHYIQPLLTVLAHPTLSLRRGAVLDLGATGYLPEASAIATAAVEANIKLIALKAMMDRQLSCDSRPTPQICSVLTWIDTLL